MEKTTSSLHAELADREAIRDCLMRYARAIDRCDEALLATVFWPDASVDFKGFIEGPVAQSLPQMIALLRDSMEHTSHLMGNSLIVIEGDTASVESYITAFHRLRDTAAASNMVLGGRYLDRFTKREDRWRISKRVLTCDWFTETHTSQDNNTLLGLEVRRGNRAPLDYSYFDELLFKI